MMEKLKASLRQEMSHRLDVRKHEIKRAHSEDRKRRLLEVGRQTKDKHSVILEDYKRELELEQQNCLIQLEEELSKEHERAMEQLRLDMQSRLKQARGRKR